MSRIGFLRAVLESHGSKRRRVRSDSGGDSCTSGPVGLGVELLGKGDEFDVTFVVIMQSTTKEAT
jgi:hypothetical protein